MTYLEFVAWVEYLRKRGTLHMGLALERGLALIATQISRATGGKAEPKDFMPHFDDTPISLEDAMKQWT